LYSADIDMLMSGWNTLYLARNDNLDPQVDHACRAFRSYEIATTSTTVRSSWEKAGFRSVGCDGVYYLWIDEGRIRASLGDVEAWQVDYPEERLSQRTR
jgi:hypothetical protein